MITNNLLRVIFNNPNYKSDRLIINLIKEVKNHNNLE